MACIQSNTGLMLCYMQGLCCVRDMVCLSPNTVCPVKHRVCVVSNTGFLCWDTLCVLLSTGCVVCQILGFSVGKHCVFCQAQAESCVKYGEGGGGVVLWSAKDRMCVVSNRGFVFWQTLCSVKHWVCVVPNKGVVSCQTLCVLSSKGFVMSQIQDLSFGKHSVVVHAQGVCYFKPCI